MTGDNDNNNPQVIRIATPEDQRDDEARFVERGRERSETRRKRQEKLAMSETTAADKFVQQVFGGVEAQLVEAMLAVEQRKGGPEPKFYAPIKRTSLTLTAEMAVRTVMDAVGKRWTRTKTLKSLGKALQVHLFATIMEESRAGDRLIKQLERKAELRAPGIERRRDYVLRYATSKGYQEVWPEALTLHVGSTLYNAVMMGCSLFMEVKERLQGDEHPTVRIELTPEAQKLLDEHNTELDLLNPMLGPMNRPPRPWGLDQIGPYYRPDLAMSVDMVTNIGPPQQADIDAAMRSGQLDDALEALTTLGDVPLAINEYTVRATEWILENGHGEVLRKFPDLAAVDRPVKLEPEDFDRLTVDEKIRLQQEVIEVDTFNSAVRANNKVIKDHLREANKQLEDGMAFFLPYHWCTRSRVMPVPAFSYHAEDYLRSFFMFAVKEPVGDNDAFLMLELANSYGNDVDKGTLDERCEWVEANMEMILRCGEDFTTSFDDWRKAATPLQFLAAAREMYQFKLHGPEYETGLRIALDAAQSGVQHYSAASLSEPDGRLVNLVPQDEPNDLYRECLRVAKKMMAQDIEDMEAQVADNPITEDDDEETAHQKMFLQRKLEGAKITLKNPDYNRNVMKRNCMTRFYGSDHYGFAEQLRNDWLNDYNKMVRSGDIAEHPYGDDRGFAVSVYLGDLHERAIDRVVSSAASGMNFFKKCAAALAREGKHFKFVTPLGFPMHQYYRTHRSANQRLMLYNRTVDRPTETMLSARRYQETLNSRKSVDAISPNIIHSMDATHLMKTVLLCKEMGVTNLMVVHDSFATTIGSAMTMSWAIRRAFVDLYDGYCLYTDILQQVREQLDDPDAADLPEVPPKGSLDLQGVMDSDYNFC